MDHLRAEVETHERAPEPKQLALSHDGHFDASLDQFPLAGF